MTPEEAGACVSEGHCPYCLARLTPLTPEQVAETAEWVSPPVGVCPSDHSDGGRWPGPFYVGPYSQGPGAYVSLRTSRGGDSWIARQASAPP